MNFKVNFQKAKRNYMVLTFDDEREENGKTVEFEKVIHVGMPKKRVFHALIDMQEIVEKKRRSADSSGKERSRQGNNRRIIRTDSANSFQQSERRKNNNGVGRGSAFNR